MKYVLSTFVVLVIFWLGNSGHYSYLLLALGLGSILFVIFVAHRMNVIDHESQPFYILGRKLPGYYLWLIRKLVESNIDVVKRVWLGNSSISPSQATLPMTLKTPMAKVVYANSITLTPGTVAIDLGEQTIFVHALTLEAIEELERGEMHNRVAQLERN